MALTSERLKDLTRQRMELIREIDRNPSDANLQGRMSCVDTELSKERYTLITNDNEEGNRMNSVQQPVPAAAPASAPAPDIEQKLPELPKKVKVARLKARPKAPAPKKGSKNAGKSKKLSEFF
jgi:hypothetical protein